MRTSNLVGEVLTEVSVVMVEGEGDSCSSQLNLEADNQRAPNWVDTLNTSLTSTNVFVAIFSTVSVKKLVT